MQYRAGKIITGAISRTSHELVNRETGWTSLAQRRQNQRLKVFYKMTNNEAPKYLCDEVPVIEQGHYNLRNESNIPNIRGRTVFYENTFIPNTIRDWNSLPLETRRIDTKEAFASQLSSNEVPTPDWYYSGNRQASVWHARLRMLCSPLNDHLYTHIHVIESPACACGHARENSKHFLQECPLYLNERTTMLNELQRMGFQPTLKNILYGSSKYTADLNCRAFLVIQEFLVSSDRF